MFLKLDKKFFSLHPNWFTHQNLRKCDMHSRLLRDPLMRPSKVETVVFKKWSVSAISFWKPHSSVDCNEMFKAKELQAKKSE